MFDPLLLRFVQLMAQKTNVDFPVNSLLFSFVFYPLLVHESHSDIHLHVYIAKLLNVGFGKDLSFTQNIFFVSTLGKYGE